MANRSAKNTSQGYVLCCGCRYFHEWMRSSFAHARSPIWLFRCAGISFVYWKIFKLATWNLQKVIWDCKSCHLKTISCNIKWLYRKKYEHLCSILWKEGLCHLAITYKSIIQHKIPWGCSCAIYKVSSIDVRSRWIIRLRDMTPSLKKYRVIKVVLQHVSDSKLVIIKKFS